ncbi:MAG: SDR family oxidoreductase [bacterium]
MAQQKHSVITGGIQGIGRTVAQILHERGDHVTICDIIDSSDSRVTALKSLGFAYIQVDVSSVASIQTAFEAVSHIDILVNNAGITRDGLALRMREQDWDAVLDVNLKGAFFVTQCALKKMIKNSMPEAPVAPDGTLSQGVQTQGVQTQEPQVSYARGYIINMSSIVAASGNPGQVNYAASKAGITSLTKTLAQEYASRHILVNAIAPGFIQTAMTDKLDTSVKEMALARIALKRFGSGHDVAQVVEFLTSGRADYITGQVIEVSGGMI